LHVWLIKIKNNKIPDPTEIRAGAIANQKLVQLIDACMLGDKSAFETLYKETSPQLYAVLRWMLKSDALAEEALQESYVKIWNKTADYDSEKSQPRTWLVSIARYHAIDTLRKHKVREDKKLQIGTTDVDEFAGANSPFDKQFEDSEQLTLCLDELSEFARRCVVGAYCIGFSQE
jgi:RNA polymerase sigma-70 factor (ECF subfamily)